MCRHLFKYFEHPKILGKSAAVYGKANRFAEKFSKIINFFLVRVTICLVLCPKAIVSFFVFYTTDAGPDAFELALPIW